MEKPNVKEEVFTGVYNEFMSLLGGRGSNLTIQESQELKDYARVRTDLKKQDQDLNDEQQVWKYIYYLLDEQMEKTIGKEEKIKLDDLADSYHKDIACLDTIDTSMTTITKLAEEIDNLIAVQWEHITANWDESTGYRKGMDVFSEKMLDKNTSNESHIQFAEKILNLITIHKEKLGNSLKKVNDDLQKQLLEAKKCLDRMNTLIEEGKVNKLLESQPEITEAVTLFGRWYEATKELYLVRRIQANYVLSQEKWDSEIPKAVIEHKGDINNEIQNSFIEEIRKGAADCKVAQEKDQELDKERILLSEKIIGKKSIGVVLNQSVSPSVDEHQTISGKKGKVKKISISLGVVLLGLVLVEMGATIFGYVIVLFGVVYGIKIILMK